MKVTADYVVPEKGDPHIKITFPFDPVLLSMVKSIPGARFIAASNGGPAWRVPADIATAKLLRKKLEDRLVLTDAMKAWGREKVKASEELTTLALANTATLTRLPSVLPGLYNAVYVGPRGAAMTPEEFEIALKEPEGSFQTADIAFMARAGNPINANQPGMGKTLETIGAVFEADLDNGPNLVIAPVTSLDVVWRTELEKWQQHPVLVASDNKALREEAVFWAQRWTEQGKPFWLVCSPGMIQFRRNPHAIGGDEDEFYILYPQVHEIEWNTVTLDEFHKMGLGNTATLTNKAVNNLKAKKRIALSGTPLQGKPIKLYGVLNWLHPEEFKSKWRFADMWLEIDTVRYGRSEHRNIGGIREDRREEFDEMLTQYLTRRTKAECLPWLPPKQYQEIWAEMDGRQEKQYKQFALEAEIRIEDEKLTATSILAEYTRLKQFADSEQKVMGYDKEGKVIIHPTTNSCKLAHVMQLLDERGIRKEDPEGEEQVVIFSQFSKMVDMVTTYLNEHDIPARKLTGEISAKNRGELVRDFQSGQYRVLVMTTTAGGVSITLDKADTVILLDETWSPDDQEQAVDRVHRGSKDRQVLVYTIRTKGTIEEYVQEVNLEKTDINHSILDLRRLGLRALRNG